MDPLALAALAAGAGLLGATAILIVGLRQAARVDDTGVWQLADLAALAGPACPVCQGRHCAGCEAPARITALPHRHVARHDLAGTPPSIMPALALMTPVERAHELVRQLGQAAWTPYAGLPARLRVRMQAATIARRHGLPLLLGTFERRSVLP